jgi:hypothetical protein
MTTMATNCTYYVKYPRDFSNEYTVYQVPPKFLEDFKREIPEATRITSVKAHHMITATTHTDNFGSYFCATEVQDLLMDIMDRKEREQAK